MLRKAKDMRGYKLDAGGEVIGKIEDLFFDDESWNIRYMVIDTGNWFVSNLVLISPQAITQPDWREKTISTGLSKEVIENGPAIEKNKPVSRRKEIELFDYYKWTPYWNVNSGPAGLGAAASVPPLKTDEEMPLSEDEEKGDPNLRSYNEVAGYRVYGADDEVGKVDDFLFDDLNWVMSYVVIDLGSLFKSEKILMRPDLIAKINWGESAVNVKPEKEKLENAPRYDEDEKVTKEFEEEAIQHYN